MGLHRGQGLNAHPLRFSLRRSWDASRSLALLHQRARKKVWFRPHLRASFLKPSEGSLSEVDFGGLTSKTLCVTSS